MVYSKILFQLIFCAEFCKAFSCIKANKVSLNKVICLMTLSFSKLPLTLSPLTSGRGVAPSDKCHFKPRSSRLLLSPGGQWTSNSVRSCVAKARVITHFRRGSGGQERYMRESSEMDRAENCINQKIFLQPTGAPTLGVYAHERGVP